jgi:hypothetical protein
MAARSSFSRFARLVIRAAVMAARAGLLMRLVGAA